MNIIDWYLEDHPANFKQLILSDGVGRSEKLLSTLSSRRTSSKLDIAVLSPSQPSDKDLQPFLAYVRDKYINSEKGASDLAKSINEFKANCNTNPRRCTPDNILKATDYVIQMIQATVAVIHAFKQSHNSLCGESTVGLCDQLVDSQLFYHNIQSHLQKSNTFISLGKLNFTLDFNYLGELIPNVSQPIYSFSQLHGGNLTYGQIASYHHKRSWLPRLPPKSVSRCATGCEKCALNRPPYVFKKNFSPFVIAGMGQVHKSKNQFECENEVESTGFIRMEAFYYAVEQIVNITGIEFSSLFIDPCYAKVRTQRILTTIFQFYSSISLYEIDGTQHVLSPNHIVIFIGGASSDSSIILQNYLGPHGIPQISYASTSVYLDDSLRYSTFLRNVPSDEMQARLVINLIKFHGWENVGLLHSRSAYGEKGANLVKKYAEQNNVCISFTEKIDLKAVKNISLKIKSRGEQGRLPRPIILFMEHELMGYLVGNISLYDMNWKRRGNFFIASETWGTNKEIVDGKNDYVKGTLTISLDDAIHNWTSSANGINYFQEFVRTQTFVNQYHNELFLKFWQQHFQCHLPTFINLYNKECENGTNLVDSDDSSSSNQLDFEDAVSKHIVGAGLSFAYSVREAMYGERICFTSNDCADMFMSAQGRKDLFRLLLTTKIPPQIHHKSKTYLPILPSRDGRSNYKVFNIQGNQGEYRLVYEVVDGKLIEKATPLFYENDEQQTKFNSTLCPDCACSNGPDSLYPTTAQPNRYVLNPSVLLAIIIALLIIIFLTSMLVVYASCKLWRPADRSTPYQYVDPVNSSEHQISGKSICYTSSFWHKIVN